MDEFVTVAIPSAIPDDDMHHVQNCPACNHTTPAGAVCQSCQPFGTEGKRCVGCAYKRNVLVWQPQLTPPA